MSGSLGNPNGGPIAVTNGNTPKSARIFSFSTTLSTGVAQSIDLRSYQNLNALHDAQGIYIDNSANSSAVSIQTASGQNITCPPNSQGICPLFISASMPVFTFSGNGVVNINLLNFPCPAMFWATETTGEANVISGKLQVQDVLVESLIINGAYSSSEALYGNGDTIQHARGGTTYSGSFNAAGGPTVLITGAPSSFVSGIFVSGLSTEAGTMVLTFQFTVSGQSITIPVSGKETFITCNLLGSLTGDNYEVTATGTLTGGTCYYTVFGGTTGLA